MKVSVIVSTYNNPAWLEKTLWGYLYQNHSDFNIIVADDGSGQETAELIQRFQNETPLQIQHIWHEDRGFQKCQILNQAIVASSDDYLIFTDGDCIPRADFISQHIQLAEPNTFLSGGYCKLPMNISKAITRDDIKRQKVFNIQWLKTQSFSNTSSFLKLGLQAPWNKLADTITTTKPTWNGCNASTWKKHLIKVNGHDERMQYGGEDREMGSRLLHIGLKPKQIRHRAVLTHLDHARAYATPESIEKNMQIRKETLHLKKVSTAYGIQKEPSH
ncbi:MAG: glycosyltransferase family 2 protein [Akkermansiaceae bacterium]